MSKRKTKKSLVKKPVSITSKKKTVKKSVRKSPAKIVKKPAKKAAAKTRKTSKTSKVSKVKLKTKLKKLSPAAIAAKVKAAAARAKKKTDSDARKLLLIKKYRHKGRMINENMQKAAINLCEKMHIAGIKCSYQYIIDKLYELVNYYIKNKSLPPNLSQKDAFIASKLDFDDDYYHLIHISMRMLNKHELGELATTYINQAFQDDTKKIPFNSALALIDYQCFYFVRARERYLNEIENESVTVLVYMCYETLTRTMFINFNDFILDGGDRVAFIDLLEDEVLADMV